MAAGSRYSLRASAGMSGWVSEVVGAVIYIVVTTVDYILGVVDATVAYIYLQVQSSSRVATMCHCHLY